MAQDRESWDESYKQFYMGLLGNGINGYLLASLMDILQRIDHVLPDRLQNIEFSADSVQYKALNETTGNMNNFCKVTVNNDWFTLSWPRTSETTAGGTINIGTDTNQSDRGQKKVMYKDVASIPAEDIERFREAIRQITGRKNLPKWQ